MRKRLCTVLVLFQVIMLCGCGAEAPSATLPDTAVTQPQKQFITVDGKQKELAGSTELIAGYTQDNLVQFTDFYDFGLRDERPLGFSGKVSINGIELSSAEYRFDGYPDISTIVLKLYQGNLLTSNILTISENSVIFYDRQAVVIKTAFNAMWDGEKWIDVSEKHGG